MKRIVLALLGFVFLSFGVDELFIRVKVLDYDQKAGVLKVEGISGSCRGYKMNIKVGNSGEFKNLIGKDMYLTIDSNTCKDGGTYGIIRR